MKKKAILLILLFALVIYAVDQKITELGMISIPDVNDLVYIIDDPCGTPASYAIPWKDFFTGYTGGSGIVTVGTIATGVWNGTAIDAGTYTNLTAGDHITLTDDDLDVDDDFLLNTGDSGTGAYDFGGATSVEIPNGNNPTADAAGEIAWDANDYALEVFDGTNARLIPSTRFFSATIIQPADVQPNIDAVPILPVEAYWAPFGIKLLHVGIKTNSSSSLTVNFEEWTSPSDASPSTIESVATSTSYEAEDDGTLTDPNIAAGSIIYVDLDTTDVNSLTIWGTYFINDGD